MALITERSHGLLVWSGRSLLLSDWQSRRGRSRVTSLTLADQRIHLRASVQEHVSSSRDAAAAAAAATTAACRFRILLPQLPLQAAIRHCICGSKQLV